ncbi:MAG: phosphoribosylamine--glycine ligase [Candidatus Lokiarchaeota archaeon]|nr:phosphoribosylamine--glycine ligase [Candidatus Lokiarchaeota archaeon]MBD3337907.1 phosphoribosylamine--glycine ligase [Candidatus Lokiarchaeota archaeon]
MVNCLVVGHGAREHVIGEALVKSGARLYAYMSFKNAGLEDLSEGRIKVDSETDFKKIIGFCKERGIDFAVIGPEAPLTVGIVDALERSNIPCVGPGIEAAQIEGSKVFMRELLEKYNIESNLKSKKFRSIEGLEEYINEMGEERVVVKPDGLTGGKGVKVYGDHLFSKSDILDYCKELISRGDRFLIEEKADGEEFTLQTFVDGKNVVGTPLVQDHKRAYEDDEGPNTGGMGSYSMEDHLMPFIDDKDVETSLRDMRKVVEAIKKETGTEYKGFLYGQFMKCADGIKLIEFNARLGDPEAMNILPILNTSFVDICWGIINGNLSEDVSFEKKATVCKYLAPEGYPISPRKDQQVIIDKEKLNNVGAKFYYASVYREGSDIYTTTSRAMGILGVADTLENAERIAEQGVECVEGKLFHRKDVGTKNLLQKRIDHMNSLLKEQ